MSRGCFFLCDICLQRLKCLSSSPLVTLIGIMPRKPKKCRQLVKDVPFAFSPFGRSLARVASACRAKRRMRNPQSRIKYSTNSSGNGFSNRALKDEIENSESCDEDENEQSESSGEDDFDGVVQVNFTAVDPKPDDFHGVKVLLRTYLDDRQWDLSGFVDLILEQSPVGTVVKVEDDEDDGVYSIVTALNLQKYKDHKCIMELKQFLLKVCLEKDTCDKLRSFLAEQAQDVGLLVSQHVVNLPPQLLPPLYNTLFDEVSRTRDKEPTEELRNAFCFKFYLLISRIYKHKNGDQKKGKNRSSDEAIIYVKPEDEIFHKLCSWSFTFSLHTQELETHELKNYQLMGLVMAVEATKIPIFRQELQALIDE